MHVDCSMMMKIGSRKQLAALAVFAAFVATCHAAATYTETVDGITWTFTVENGCASVGGGFGHNAVPQSTLGAIVIPSFLGGCPVTRIESYAFSNCRDITTVVIGNGVTGIGSRAFDNCSGLANLVIGNGVTNIAYDTFYGCDGIRSLTIPQYICNKRISYFFGGIQQKLENLNISGGVTNIVDEAFESCSELTSVTISDSVTNIGKEAFSWCNKLVNIKLPNGLRRLGTSAFCGCSGLTSVTIPDGVPSIEKMAFYKCKGLATITIPSSVTSISQQAFEYCESLTNIVFKGNAPTMASSVFFKVPSDCVVHVSPSSTGWGVEIPGTWNGMRIEYFDENIPDEPTPDDPVPHQVAPNLALGFEEYEVGTLLTEENCAALATPVDETMSLLVETPMSTYENIDRFTPPFSSAGEKCLRVKTTFGNPCAFSLQGDKSSVEISAGDSYVIDFLARFTNFDESPSSISAYSMQSADLQQSMSLRGGTTSFDGQGEIDEITFSSVRPDGTIIVMTPKGFICGVDDKIMMWQQEVYDEHYDIVLGTNWYVRAANGSGGTTDYVLTSAGGEPLPEDDNWHRVTFKACRVEGSDALFFNVFIDGREACSGDIADFHSMSGSPSIATVRFDGTGDVDNILACDGITFDKLANGGESEEWVNGANLEFSTGGAAEWFADSVNSHDGNGSLRSGVVENGEETWIETTVSGECRLSFWWKASSECYDKDVFDYAYLSIDGVPQGTLQDYKLTGISIGGTTGWTNVVIDICGKGDHAIRWTYVKDEIDESDVGEDCVWLDAVLVMVRQPTSPAECLNVEGDIVSTGSSDAAWTRVLGAEAHDGVAALKSGAIHDNESSTVTMTVSGPGSLSFWWKSSSKISRNRKFDYVSFLVDGHELSWLGGERDWTNEVFKVDGIGVHTLEWVYSKNDNGLTQGQDCAWLDEVTWTPSVAAESFPEVATNAAPETVAAAFSGATDAGLAANVTDGTNYNAFCEWAARVKGASGSAAVGAQAVKESARAWLSYALGADRLIGKEIATNDVQIVGFDVVEGGAMGTSRPTSFAFEVAIDGVNIGGGSVAEAVLKENLKKVLGVEGAAELNESAFSSNGLTVTLQRTADGKAKATVTPDGTPPAFFLRVKVK